MGIFYLKGNMMKPTKEQKRLIQESILNRLVQWISDNEYKKAKRMFENDPTLQKQMKDIYDKLERISKKWDDYCKEYGCVEVNKHTKKLPTFAELRAEKKRNKL